ncbi:FAD-binding and (Fe-S)-binding domain-containing protein [uncultured Paraglaciecola sp.]|uniref:FAD-binding and (Fe-S)-binding domain-containing protein n=1 Tax=uncultured Paraglaciecola sp. TaxID=1765024 RepID=UPI002607FAF6|nr:FAD-binding and (Fe-S)-binding domain-containing protein [uncultured Paraglaciecola sp.]
MRGDRHKYFAASLQDVLPKARIITDYSKRFAYGVDASFYRLIPKVVVFIDDEQELVKTIQLAVNFKVAVTFRASGTSLSGQAQSDSVLIMLTNNWRWHEILDLGGKIKLGPGVIGADANRYLLPYGRKLGPDPASIDTCKIAGIAANNASGMCCGVTQNSYHTLANIRVVLQDGSIFDNSNQTSIKQFKQKHPLLLSQLSALSQQTKENLELKQLIEHKYRLKNTTGYGINALIDFDDPIDMLAHLMIGSEGTLGFISSITYHTVIEHKHRASSLVLFPNIEITCAAVSALADANVSAVELLDYPSLLSVNDQAGIPAFIDNMPEGAGALLIETRANNQHKLSTQIIELTSLLASFEQCDAVGFTAEPQEYNKLWAIRKKAFPAIGANRETGTTVIIEDVAFPVAQLSAGVSHLQALFKKFEYFEAIIFGHALDGNLHFVFTQDFSTAQEIKRYESFMHEVCQLVAVDYKGSLKAEHGTGRNMAPFVELEWGEQGYQLMKQIKVLFDPQNLLNPNVIINPDNQAHIKHLKALPKANEIVDKCIECGFCEPVCPSKGLSFTPRQRISNYREIQRLRVTQEDQQTLKELETDFQYSAIDTCATTGLCAQHCPVGINTGELVLSLRHDKNTRYENLANKLVNHFGLLEKTTRLGLTMLAAVQRLVGDQVLSSFSAMSRKISFNHIPKWLTSTPNGSRYYGIKLDVQLSNARNKVVYFPSCASRTMGQGVNASVQLSLTEVTLALLEKANFEVISPDFSGVCCGMPFNSQGMVNQAKQQQQTLMARLLTLSENGQYPILFDTSPCKSMFESGELEGSPLTVYEPVSFTSEILAKHLDFTPTDESVMLHVTCSSQKMGLQQQMQDLAKRCSTDVIIPEHIHCCGFSGSKGFTTPELNASALSGLKAQIPKGCTQGYSNSRTCEIGLSHHSGIHYQSILYLVNKVTSRVK